ncbi:MAG TPA: ABC transporter permease [Acidimicrobiales bacterium]|nr:ABC transporter permease [Acidimicrobiales bacterium]
MLGYTARRLLQAVLVVIGVTVATFLLMHVEPGDPARVVLGLHASPRAIAALNAQWGLDSSLPAQLWHYLDQLAHGNLGQSYINKVSVSSLIGARIGVTAALVGVATLFSVAITVPLAVLAAASRDRLADHLVRGAAAIGLGMPAFWFGIVLIEVFAVHLHLLPVGGEGSGFGGALESLVLPATTAALAIVPLLARSLRVGMIEVLDADFVAAARAKGLPAWRVLFFHAARNALVPTVTLLGLNIAYLIGSTVIVEQVFDLNGLGSLLLSSIDNHDFPAVQSTALVLGAAVVAVNLATDLLAARLDPRIRLG